MTYYHVTLETRLSKIINKGILPNQKPVWTNSFGVVQRKRGFVYASDTYDEACRWAFKTNWELKERIAIVQFFVGEGAPVTLDQHIENMNRGWVKIEAAVPTWAFQIIYLHDQVMKDVKPLQPSLAAKQAYINALEWHLRQIKQEKEGSWISKCMVPE